MTKCRLKWAGIELTNEGLITLDLSLVFNSIATKRHGFEAELTDLITRHFTDTIVTKLDALVSGFNLVERILLAGKELKRKVPIVGV